jgi:hypothetical protein
MAHKTQRTKALHNQVPTSITMKKHPYQEEQDSGVRLSFASIHQGVQLSPHYESCCHDEIGMIVTMEQHDISRPPPKLNPTR